MANAASPIKSILLFVTCLLSAHAAEPWDTPFSADTAGLVKRAGQLSAPDDQVVQILLEDHLISVQANGRVHSTLRKVYRILKEGAVEVWSSVERSYQPWREQKPAIRARVITRSGSVHMLDPKTIADSPAAELESNLFSDTRVVRAPLPAIEPGAVVEFEVVSDSGPAFPESGVTRRIPVVDAVPLERFHLVIDAPAGAALQTAFRQIADSAVHRTTTKNGAHIECELGPFKPRKTVESGLPPDVAAFPYVAFSTASAWNTLAARYSEIVDQQIQSADVKSLLEGTDLKATPLAIAAGLATRLHRSVRYTGVEFGDAAVVPTTPSQVLQRRYGDCKDKATLLVAALRAAGLSAYVALLRSGYDTDVDPGLPGIDLFDHAIVYVDGPQPLWIDATANHLRVGILPSQDQGRLALIARKQTTDLVKIPERVDCLDRHEYAIQFKDYGHGSITEVMESNGPSEAYLRNAYTGGDSAKAALEKYVKGNYAAKRLGAFETSGEDDLSLPVRVSVEAVETPQVVTAGDSANVVLGASLLLQSLPWQFQAAARGVQLREPEPPRTNGFVFPQAGVTERVFKLYPPALYKVGNLPASESMDLGPLRLSQTFKAEPNGVVEADYRLEIPKRRISAAEYEAVRAALEKYSGRLSERINFLPQTSELLAIGKTSEALALMRESVAKHAEDASAHIRLSRVLVSAGLGIPARTEAERATELDPKSSQAWQALAWAWQNDTFGRLRRGDWSRPEALKALRKAVELDPDDTIAKADLAILLEFNDHGERYAGNNEQEAIALYRELLKKPNAALESNLTSALFYNGQLDEARAESHKCPDEHRILFQTLIQDLQNGAGPAIVNLQSAVADQTTRAQYLIKAAFALMHLRRYPDALLFLQALMRITNNPQAAAFINLVSATKRFEDGALPDTDPRAVEQKVIALFFADRKPTTETLAGLLTFAPTTGDWVEELESAQKEAFSSAGLQQLIDLGLTRQNFQDLLMSNLNLKQEGDDARGYRIAGSGLGAGMPKMYVVRVGSTYKIIGSTDSMDAIGQKVLDLLKQNDLDNARWWLDRSIPDMKMDSDGWLPAARSIWPSKPIPVRGRELTRLAAASLIAHDAGSDDAIAILKEEYPKVASAFDKSQIDQALCEAYAKSKQWAALATGARRLMTSSTFSGAGFEFLMKALEEQKDWKAMESAALAETRKKEPSRHAWKYLAIARIASGGGSGATEAIAHLKSSGDGSDTNNFTAWNEVRQGKVSQETLDSLKKTVGTAPIRNPYLVALLEVQLKKTEDAHQTLKQAVQAADATNLDARAWVLYGDLCGQYGFPEAAKQAWARARAAKSTTREAQWALATLESQAH